jgi:uncharacterized repeat protein (TIGR01451 family)
VAVDHEDQWPLDDESCHVVQVNAPGPNLAIEKNYQWNGDGQLEYGIQLYNLGTTLLSNGVFTDSLPADTAFNGNWWAWFQEPVTLTHQSASELAWTFRRMEPGWSAGLAFQVDLAGELVGVPGLAFTNTVEAPVAGDVAPADNFDMVTAYTGPDLYVEKHHSGGEPVPGGLITFTIEFGNANGGPWGTSAGTHLTDTLPAAMTFVTATAPWDPGQRWTPVMTDGGTVVWEWWDMGPGNTLFFDIVAEIDPEAANGDVLVNTIQVASDAPEQDVEYDYSNNTDTASVTVMAGYYIYLPIVSRDS